MIPQPRDAYRGNGTFELEEIPRVTPWFTLWAPEVVSVTDAGGKGTYWFGDTYDVAITIRNNYFTTVMDVALAPAVVHAGGHAGELDGLSLGKQTVIVAPRSTLVVHFTGKIVEADASLRFEPVAGSSVARVVWRDLSEMAKAERAVQVAAGGRLARIMPTVSSDGKFKAAALPASSALQRFTRLSDANETWATRQARWWDGVIDDPAYIVDYDLMVLQSVYENSYSKARSGDVLQGGDWRIWLFNLIMELVQTVVSMGASHGISSKLAVKKIGEEGTKSATKKLVKMSKANMKDASFMQNVRPLATPYGSKITLSGTVQLPSTKQWFMDALKNILKETRDEMLIENGVANLLSFFGLPDAKNRIRSNGYDLMMDMFGPGYCIRLGQMDKKCNPS